MELDWHAIDRWIMGEAWVGQLARILLRLSHLPPEEWPENPVTVDQVRERLNAERGTVVRVF